MLAMVWSMVTHSALQMDSSICKHLMNTLTSGSMAPHLCSGFPHARLGLHHLCLRSMHHTAQIHTAGLVPERCVPTLPLWLAHRQMFQSLAAGSLLILLLLPSLNLIGASKLRWCGILGYCSHLSNSSLKL